MSFEVVDETLRVFETREQSRTRAEKGRVGSGEETGAGGGEAEHLTRI